MERVWELFQVAAPLLAIALLLIGCGGEGGQGSQPPSQSKTEAPSGESATSAGKAAPAAVEPVTFGGIRNVHRAGSVICAGQPTEQDLALLHDDGVRVIVDLRKADENRGFDEAAAAKQAGLTYLNPGFSGGDELTDEVFDKVRAALRDSAKAPVFVHCGSANRVGGVWLTYRVLDQGVDFDTALKEAKEIGLRTEAYVDKARDYVERKRAESASPAGSH